MSVIQKVAQVIHEADDRKPKRRITDRNGRYFEVASKRDGVEDLIGGRA